jgi:uncharacterized protein involved in exopolysaccharide biosynthesis
VTAAVVGIALGYSFAQTPIYQSTAEVLVRPVTFDPTLPSSAPGFINMETERRVASSADVAQKAADRLQRQKTPIADISVETTEGLETLTFTASSPKPAAAAGTAQAYAQAYVELREEEVLEDLLAARQPIEAAIQALV